MTSPRRRWSTPCASGAGELLEDVQLFDVYTGPQIGEGRKSLTLALRFRAADRTLTEDEASAARDAAVAAAAERVGAVQRRCTARLFGASWIAGLDSQRVSRRHRGTGWRISLHLAA